MHWYKPEHEHVLLRQTTKPKQRYQVKVPITRSGKKAYSRAGFARRGNSASLSALGQERSARCFQRSLSIPCQRLSSRNYATTEKQQVSVQD